MPFGLGFEEESPIAIPAIGSLDPPAGFGGADEVSPPGGESGFGLPIPMSIPGGIELPPAGFAGDGELASPSGEAGAEPVKPPAGLGEASAGGELLPLSPPLGLGGDEDPPEPICMPGGIAPPAPGGFGEPGSPPGMPGDFAEPISYKSLL